MGGAPRSQARRLSALRQFYKFLAAEGLRPDDPTATLDAPRLGRSLPKLLNEAEVDRLIAVLISLAGVGLFALMAWLTKLVTYPE